MKLKMSVFSALCSLETFVINDIQASESDFVDKYDHSPETAEDYACGDMIADIKEPTPEVLERYGITKEEYQEIASKVARALSFGSCGWCV